MPTPCTVTGTLNLLTGGLIGQGKVLFQLTNIGTGNPIGVSGTAVIPSLTYQTITAQNGTFTVSLWGNDVITPANTQYSVTFSDAQGNSIGPVLYSITGASVNLNTLAAAGSILPPIIFSGLGAPKFQQFTANGTFTIPATITGLKVTVVAGGGGGGGSPATVNGGGGGGAGSAAIKWLSGLTPGNTLAVTVGTGGPGGAANTNGTSGTGSTVASGTQTITSIITNGGAFGGNTGGGGAPGGAGTGGDLNFAGGSGTGSVTAPGPTQLGGQGGAAIFGGESALSGGVGQNGGVPGAGGGGAAVGSLAGGNGANGIVIFEWVG